MKNEGLTEVTVFTPTYNRASLLGRLYKSLEKQTNKKFEWVIVDDGSTDDTREKVKFFRRKATFPIRYIYKRNEGKHIAINEGVKIASGKWFFIVDSDDYLTESAIETVLQYCKSIEGDPNCAGVVGLRGNSNREILFDYGKTYGKRDKFFQKEYIDATSIEYRYKYKIHGDRAEVLRTKLLKRYPFPKFKGERFLTEGYLWLSLSRDGYYFRWFNKIIYITEYLADGLSANMSEIARNNPQATFFMADFCLGIKGLPFIEYLKNSCRYYLYGKINGNKTIDLIRKDKKKVLALSGILLAWIKG